MKTKYTPPMTEIIDLISKGYLCAAQDVMLGGSKPTENGFGNQGGDEAKLFTPIDDTEWPSYNLWDD